MNAPKITLTLLTDEDRDQFVLDNQYAFRYGACEEFGPRDDHFEEDGEIISRETIEKSIDGGAAYRIRLDGKIVGGLGRGSEVECVSDANGWTKIKYNGKEAYVFTTYLV